MFRSVSIQAVTCSLWCPACTLAALGLYNLNTMSQIRERANLLETNILPSLMAVAELNNTVTRLRVQTLRLMLTTDINNETDTLRTVDELRQSVLATEKRYEALINMDEERRAYNEFAAQQQQYLKLQQESIESLKQDEIGLALDLPQQINPLTDAIVVSLARLTKLNEDAAAEARKDSIAAYEQARILVIVLIVLAVAIAVVIALVISASINQPLAQAVNSAQQIAEGDLTQRISSEGGDELTQLSDALVQMQQKLRDAIGHIASSASQLASAAEELNAVTDESARAIQLQNDEVQQAATAITEMSSAVDEVASDRHANL
ncbi:methyl-accepting chemotaxis protein [Alishewanella longhuensis]